MKPSDTVKTTKWKRYKLPLILLVCVLTTVLIILSAFSVYQKKLSKSVLEVSGIFLEELSLREVSHLQTHLKEQQENMQIIISLMGRMPKDRTEMTMQRYLGEMQESYHLRFLALVEDNAQCLCAAQTLPAYSVGSALNLTTLETKRQFTTAKGVDGREIVLLSSPMPALTLNGKRYVALASGVDVEAFAQQMALRGTASQTQTNVVDREGEPIVYTTPQDGSPADDNLFEALETHAKMSPGYSVDTLRADVAAGRDGMLIYTLDGVKFLTHYTMAPEIGWYVTSSMPYGVIGRAMEDFMAVTIIAGLLVVLVVCGLLVVLVLSASQNQQSARRAENIGAKLAEIGLAKQEAEGALLRMAYSDELTGISNKNYFLKTADEILEISHQYAYVIMDIRRFTAINDLFGFAQGDQLLRHIAAVLQAETHGEELCARFAADEFHLLLRYRSQALLENRLRGMVVLATDFSFPGEAGFPLAISTGIYVLEPAEHSVERMGDLAKLALQRVKGLHSSELYFYNEEIRSSMMTEQEIERDMQRGIDNGEFVVYLQPKMDAITEQLAGAEVLVRWHHPTRGLLLPGLFIPVFEKNGFIAQLDMFMLREACAVMRDWLEQGLPLVPISINQSRLLLYSEGYVDQLVSILECYKIPRALIELEITESVFVEDKQRMVAIVEELHRKGFSVSMDDFGSGYSTLNMLKEIMVDVLKIDKDFFSESAHSERGRKIVQNIITMSRDLEIQVVAEGVETREQAEFLRNAGCDLLQGFYYSKPIPCQQFLPAMEKLAKREG